MKEGGLNRNKAPLFIQYPMKNLLQKCHIKPCGEMTSVSATADFVPVDRAGRSGKPGSLAGQYFAQK